MTHPNRVRLSKLSLGLMVALAAAPVFAQSTSAGVGGSVVGADGQPVAGAEVTITHVESGTVSRATTDASGRYNARGLRVGGPYTITVNKAGAGSDTEENVYLTLNKVNTVDAQLNNDVATLGTVVAVASGISVFDSSKMGSGTNVDLNTIEATPSPGGNIQDIMRLDPRVVFVNRAEGSISAAGQNPRYNAIRVDGVSANDTFGLEGNNMPTKRQSVAMEAIEAINIDLSNYDVTISGGTGAVVDAVTKSGTNKFSGSLYGKYRDGDWFGDDPLGKKFNGFTKEQNYGLTLGGPIIKDKLFFFVNYDKYHQGAPGADISGSPLGKNPPTISQAFVDRAVTLGTGYGMEPGSLDSNGDTDLEEYAAKIDWNINDNHRASFRYSHLEQSKARINAFNSGQLSLSSYWYQHNKTVDSYVGQLFSDWSDNFSTELKVSFRDFAAERLIPTNDPSVEISTVASSATSLSGDSFFMGTETNSMANQLSNKTWNVYGVGTWTLGDHDVKFGAEWYSNETYNIFARDIFGTYQFRNLDDFAAGKWFSFNFKTPLPGGDLASMAAVHTFTNLGLFVQDTWYASNNLTLTLGLRADRDDAKDPPTHNALAQTVFGIDNSDIGLGKWLIQPRAGFNYTFDTERRMQLRGGVGLFKGDSPQVWLSNAYGTNGVSFITYALTRDDYIDALKFDGTAEAPATGAPVLCPATGTSPRGCYVQDINFVSPDFEQPSVWKANLAFETETGWMDTVFSVEALLTEVNSALVFKNLNLGAPNAALVAQDGRDIFYSNAENRPWGSNRTNRNRSFNSVILVDTTDQGGSQQFTVSLNKPWSMDSDWSWTLGYTYTHATEISGLTNSTASSNWNFGAYVLDANEEVEGRSRYEIKDRFTGQLTWKHNFFGDYRTQVGLVYEGRSGRPFSYLFVNDVNGDGRSANDLFYVPSGPGDVLFGTLTTVNNVGVFTPNPTAEANFWAWLGEQDALQQYRGKVTPKNLGRAEWVNTFDLRVSQELPGFFKGHKSEIWVDVQNVGNLLNKDWGHIMDYGFFANQRIASAVGIYQGKYVYDFRSADAPTVANGDNDGFNQGMSQWSVQVGFKYKF